MKKLNKFVSMLLVVAMFFTMSINAFAANNGTATIDDITETGYVTDLKIQAAVTMAKDIPGYTFDPNTTEYSGLTLYDGIMPRITVSVNQENLYYQVYFNGQPKGKPTKLNKTENATISGVGLASITSATCGDGNRFSIRIGNISSDDNTAFAEGDYDEYTFSYTLKPTLTKLNLTDGDGNIINVSPEYKSGIWYFYDEFVSISSADEVVLSGKFTTKNTKCYIGENEYTSGTSLVLYPADYHESNSNVAKIPIRLVCDNGTESTLNLCVIDSEETGITIIQQPQSTTCDKLETPTLSIAAIASDETELSYQWFCGTGSNGLGSKPIPGATSSTYTLPKSATQKADTLYYQCEVSSTLTINGETYRFSKKSDDAVVEVQLSFVSKPNIVRELGSFYSTTGENLFKEDYRTDYTAGEKFDLMYISVEYPEDGVTLTYDYYWGTDPNNVSPLTVTFGQGWETSAGGKGVNEILTSARPTEGFAEGVYYIYCTVTATAEDGRTASETSGPVRLTFSRINLSGFEGAGTKEEPYLIKAEADLINLRNIVFNGEWCAGVYFKMEADIELSSNWTPIGEDNEALKDPVNGRTTQAFSGIFDGNGYKLTVAEGGKPLFNYVSDAVIKNLNIYGKQIDGNGLIDNFFADYGADGNYWTGVPECVTIQNVRLLSGSSTRRSGFMEGSGSGANTIHIEDCVIEKGVTIGYTHEEYSIGSFVGSMLNGEIKNSYSEADVYGTSRMGGLAGSKGQSMGMCQIVNSHFSGNLVATGNWVGGLIGGGYVSESAPNTMAVSFWNCYVDGNITGKDYVGGLFGGEEGLKGCINECWLQDSFFYGTITAEGEHVGGIIGYMASIDKVQLIENNYFYEQSGKVTKLIGEVAKYNMGGSYGFADEDTLNTFKANMGSAKTPEEFKNGTVKDLLNAGSDYRNWIQGERYPVHSGAAYLTGLSLSGEYKTVYQVGEELDLTGLVAKATWSDGTQTDVPLADLTITGFDSSKAARLTLNVAYEGATAQIVVRVEEDFEPTENSVPVRLSVSHDARFVTGELSGEVAALYDLEVPYFDLALYGLEDYYYGGTATSADGQVTMLHLFLYATEVIECGYAESEAGQGLLYENDLLNTADGKLTVTGGSGSLYMTDFWGYDQNLTYYLNYTYPLREADIGETADQIVLNDGDVVTLGHFTDWDFYTDAASGYNFIKTNAENDTVEKGQSVELSVYRTKLDNYQTTHNPVEAVLDVYYTGTDNVSEDFENWAKLTTDASGRLTVDTNVLEVGEYIFAVAGQKGSTIDAICSAPGGVILTVKKSADQEAADEVMALIDAIGEVTPESGDAIEAAEEAYEALTEEQKALVSNHQTLLDARAAYDKLVEEENPDVPVELNFSDVSTESWFYEDVAYAVANGLMNGIGNGLFAPDADTTRGMIVTILYRMEGEPAVSGRCPFEDVNSGSYYEKAIIWAAENSIVNGMGNGKFSPDDPVTREQMAVILCRYAQYNRLDISVGEDTNILSYNDALDISEYAFSAMQWVCGEGIMQGYSGNLMPRGNTTRAQIAALLHRFCEEILK